MTQILNLQPAEKQPDLSVSGHTGSGLWREAWRRLLKNPEARFGLAIIALLAFLAIFAEWIAPYGPADVFPGLDNRPPSWVQHSPLGVNGDPRFWLGTDTIGRDLFSMAVYGIRTSLVLGLASAPLIALLGMLVGSVAGYLGGRVDNWMMRITDVFYAFPPLMICILVVLMLIRTPAGGWLGGLFMLFVAFLSVGWAGAARLVRSLVLSVKNQEYIEAAHCLGVPGIRILYRHIVPNCLGPLLVWVTLMVPQLILTEAVLTYLRIIPIPVSRDSHLFSTSLGGMILEGRSIIHVQPIETVIPAVCVGLISIAFTFLGDALRDALDPESRSLQRFG